MRLSRAVLRSEIRRRRTGSRQKAYVRASTGETELPERVPYQLGRCDAYGARMLCESMRGIATRTSLNPCCVTHCVMSYSRYTYVERNIMEGGRSPVGVTVAVATHCNSHVIHVQPIGDGISYGKLARNTTAMWGVNAAPHVLQEFEANWRAWSGYDLYIEAKKKG
jgi:hypothetical protein